MQNERGHRSYLAKNKADDESRAYWDYVEMVAAKVRKWPLWKLGWKDLGLCGEKDERPPPPENHEVRL